MHLSALEGPATSRNSDTLKPYFMDPSSLIVFAEEMEELLVDVEETSAAGWEDFAWLRSVGTLRLYSPTSSNMMLILRMLFTLPTFSSNPSRIL